MKVGRGRRITKTSRQFELKAPGGVTFLLDEDDRLFGCCLRGPDGGEDNDTLGFYGMGRRNDSQIRVDCRHAGVPAALHQVVDHPQVRRFGDDAEYYTVVRRVAVECSPITDDGSAQPAGEQLWMP